MQKKKTPTKRSSGKYAYFAKLICEERTQRSRICRHGVASMCVLSAFMSQARRLPGKLALKEIVALSGKLAKSCSCFIDFTSIVDGSELAETLQVVSVHDICPKDSDVNGSTVRLFMADKGNSLPSVLSRSEAEGEILQKMPIGWVGVLITPVAAESFVKQENGFDCISLKHSGEWGARTACLNSRVLDKTDLGAELFIFRKKTDLFI